MPFISKDWRSPGEAWVKTNEGWERLKVLECVKHKRVLSSYLNKNCDEKNAETIPPHCHITIRCTREIAGFNGLGEAVRRLDFRSSVHDRRRFHYICALLRLLVAHSIVNLPGGAQRQLLQMVEEIALHVNDSQQHLNVLRGFTLQLQNIVTQESQKFWGKPLGSTCLWQEHMETIKRIQNVTSHLKIRAPDPEIIPKFYELPEECIREIILRIPDHRDLEASSSAWTLMAALISEQRIWRELIRFHFNQKQINTVINRNQFERIKNASDWKKIYHQLRRSFGVNDEHQFAEVLSLCRSCCCLFWPSDGHPCILNQSPDYKQRVEQTGSQLGLSQPVPPAQFLKFFSL